MFISRNFTGSAVAVVLAVALSSGAHAQFNHGTSVTFNGEPMFEIKGSAGGFDAEKRAWLAQDNFDNALVLASDRSADAVKVIQQNGAYTIQLDGHYIASADANSARIKNMKPEELAKLWAESIKKKLSNKMEVAAYVAQLTKDHGLSGNVAIVEKSIYAPAGTILPVRLTESVLIASSDAPDAVKAILVEDIVFDSYALPKNSVLVGSLVKNPDGKYMVQFNTLTTPSGTEVILNGLPARVAITSQGGYAAEHENIPANTKTDAREPATVGIGSNKTAILYLNPDKVSLDKGTDMWISFEKPTTVSLKLNNYTANSQ